MTELHVEPVAVQAAPVPPPPPDTPPAPAKDVAEVEHTPGGWPVVPLALAGANSTVGTLAAATLVGGPVAAAVAATGMVVLGTVAASRSRKASPRREARRAALRTAGRAGARSAALRSNSAGTRGTSRARTGSGGRSGGSRAGRGGGGLGKVPGQHRRTTDPAAGGKHSGKAGRGSSGTSLTGVPRNTAKSPKAGERLGQVKALRAAQQSAGGSRGGQRAQTTAARRAVADARRNARTSAARSGSRTGMAGRLLAGTAGKARAVRDAAIAKHRARRDAANGGAVAARRDSIRKAPARRAARQALRRSAARFHGRRLLAALLALPVGLLGCVSTWIGRKLGLPALIHPGRRLFQRMVLTAGEQRAERDENTRKTLREQETAVEAEAEQDGTDGIADSVERPATTVPTSVNIPVSEGESVSGFRFEEVASEMEQAAHQYDPENAMEILAMVEGLPAALTSVANVMKILAERSDSEFPLEKEVADAFNDIFGAVMSAVAVAEDMGPLFRQAHEQDIARHEDPRNGTEAEKGWNV
ncbi:hypothetical protein ACIQAC_02235 [Streptomyces sp. NPDC088387]|uniref:hypothetical protein n=1 Tax=Streptomyces sp. NPDC088387 TaxID=3365859 RepID=UPI003801769B